MVFTNYADFRLGFLRLADGDNISQSTFSTETADLLIGLGESRVYRDLRASTMIGDLSITPASGVYTLPAMIELREVYFSGEPPVEIVPLDKLRRLEADATASGAPTRYAAQHGDTLRFWPTASGNALGSYYKRPTLALKDETSWAAQTTFARYPECFLYAALTEAAEFLGMQERRAAWEQQYLQRINAAHGDEQKRVWGGSPLRMRAR